MKLKKLVAAFLSAVMVVSLVPAMLFSVSAGDEVGTPTEPGTEQQEKLPIKEIISAAILTGEKEYAFDGDVATKVGCSGYNASADEAANQYVGCSFAAPASITSVYVNSNYPQLKTWVHWSPELRLEVSEDGETWVKAYVFNAAQDQELASIDETVSFDSFTEEAKAVEIHFARLKLEADSSVDSSKFLCSTRYHH